MVVEIFSGNLNTFRNELGTSDGKMRKVATFKTSRPTWVRDKDVVLKKQNGSHKPSQSIPELSHFYSTQAEKRVSAPVALFLSVDLSLP